MNLKVCVLNCENLFISESYGDRKKPLHKVETLARAMTEIDADIFLLSEVGGKDSLEIFCNEYLNHRYQCHLTKGNSDRGIEVAALTRKTLKNTFSYESNCHRELNFRYRHQRANPNKYPSLRLSRDVCELWMQDEANKTIAIFLITHLKSQRDPQQIDPKGHERRNAELATTIDIFNRLSQENKCPIFIAGDFNGNASRQSTDLEFEQIYRSTQLEDALQLVNKPTPERHTYFILKSGRPARGIQLDYFFTPDSMAEKIISSQTEIFRYKDQQGKNLVFPPSFATREEYPSDHMPLVVSLKLE